MKLKPSSCTLLLLLGAFLLPSAKLRAEGIVRIDGSSTVYPVTEAVAEEFQQSTAGKIKVIVGISGTGGGFKKFTRGETDISNASRPILKEEIIAAKQNGIEFVELPIAYDALTVMINLQNTWVDYLTVAELKKIWEPAAQTTLTRWSQIRDGWPDQPIKLYGPGADSGTFDYFTEAIVGKAKSSRGDYTASEDDNVLVQGIKSDKYALGYFGYAYYAENAQSLKAVPIVPAQKSAALSEAVSPSEQTVISGRYTPLARPIFIYVNKKSLEKAEVKSFIEFYLKNAAQLASEVKYVALPQFAYQKGLERVSGGQTGTAFAGHSDSAVTIEEIFKRELKMDA